MVLCNCGKKNIIDKLLTQHSKGCNYLDHLTMEEIALINSCKLTLKNSISNILDILQKYE